MLDVEVDLVRDLGSFRRFDGLRHKERSDGHKYESESEAAEHHLSWYPLRLLVRWWSEKRTSASSSASTVALRVATFA